MPIAATALCTAVTQNYCSNGSNRAFHMRISQHITNICIYFHAENLNLLSNGREVTEMFTYITT